YTVTEITRSIKFSLETEFPLVWIEGEISNLRIPSSGHMYLTIKDEESQIKVVMFRSGKSQLKFEPKDGDQVIVKGKITVYEPRGEYQIVIDCMEPKGIGALQLAFQQLKEKLSREGLFDDELKKTLPLLPQKIGIVTSPTGAAIRDILNIIDRRFPNLHVLIAPVKVQGEGAAQEIAAAVKDLNKIKDVDAIIVGRGGGSIEDLWAFNEEVVARAIFESKIPVVSAVGHEIDFTISDFVSDLRAPTPSAAAELVVRDKNILFKNIATLYKRLLGNIRGTLNESKTELKNLVSRKVLQDPLTPIHERQQRLDEITLRMERAIKSFLQIQKEKNRTNKKHLFLLNPLNKIKQHKVLLREAEKKINSQMNFTLNISRNTLNAAMKRLNSVSPLSVLERGYAICRTYPDEKVLKDSGKVSTGDLVKVQLSKGKLLCNVTGREKEK
ncbi:MAG TPA: exodeoxyribonuclease VII large subunit, partial [Nitrospinota bacterium]|nr:exodeoxyribonuclease VII large subunit [Nitrospinota bacterium]